MTEIYKCVDYALFLASQPQLAKVGLLSHFLHHRLHAPAGNHHEPAFNDTPIQDMGHSKGQTKTIADSSSTVTARINNTQCALP
jgi:hypothetical protein